MPVINPIIFAGEQSIGTTAGAPLSTDSNNQITSGINFIEVSDTASFTVTTSTQTITTMSITPTPGTYLIMFSCDVNSALAGVAITINLAINGAATSISQRKVVPFCGGTLTSGSARCGAATQQILAITTGQTITVQASCSSNTATIASRTLDLVRLA